MNTKSIAIGLGRIGVAAAGLLIATLNLSAEVVTAHVPFAFSAAGKTLPAGDYTIEPVGPGAVVISGAESSQSAFMLFFLSSPVQHGPMGMTFDRTGGTPQLTSLRTASGVMDFATPNKAQPAKANAAALRSKK